MDPIRPEQTYVHLAEGGQATVLPGGNAFWGLSEPELLRYGSGWLVCEFEFDADWDTWEMHPNGDEFVYLLAGAVQLLIEYPEGVRCVELAGSAAVVVPRGLWHTAKVAQPCRMLHVTRGEGTRVRPRAAD